MENSSGTPKSEPSGSTDSGAAARLESRPAQNPSTSASTDENDLKQPELKLDSVTEDPFEMEVANFSAAAGQTLSGANMSFFVGLQAELLSNNGDVWYLIKILEMDLEEREVLCHYENLPNPDEWVCVDSCRMRPIAQKPKVKPEYLVNQKVMATWSDNRKFPAVIKSIQPDGSYEVLFLDGFKRTLKPNKLAKLSKKDQELFQNFQDTAESIPATPPIVVPSLPFGSDVLSKEERRKLKRKLNVKDLFADHRKRHKPEESLVVKKASNDDTSLKLVFSRKKMDEATASNAHVEKTHLTEVPARSPAPVISNVVSPVENGGSADGQKRKRFKNPKFDYDYETPGFTPVKRPVAENSVPVRKPVTENPAPPPLKQPVPVNGASPEEDTYRRIPKLVVDEKLPRGWSKYSVVKKCGANDVYIQSPEGRKCRSRVEIKAIYNDKGEIFPEERFDFAIKGGRRRKKRSHLRDRFGNMVMPRRAFHKKKNVLNKVTPVATPLASVCSLDPARRIKTLLPKAKPSEIAPEIPVTPVITPVPSVASTPVSSSGESGGTVVTANSGGAGFNCPIQNCGKLFRKENLLMMHVKHYHPEYTQMLGSTPNVADLAYARTIGQSIDEVSPSTSFLDKLNQLEKQKAAASQSPASVSSPQSLAPSPSQKRSTKPPSVDSPAPEVKEPVVTPPEPSVPAPPETEMEKPAATPVVKKQPVPVASEIPKRHGRSSLDADSASTSGKSGKKRTVSMSKSSTISDFNESSLDASESGTESNSLNGPKLEQLKKEEVINCKCGYKEEDGLMIQCDLCLCWQHGACNEIDTEEEVPEKYICFTCLHPYRQRTSRQYTYNQDWLKEGTLPKFSFRSKNNPEVAHRESLLKRSHSITATLVQLESVLHSLQAKINVAEKADHPKLYLWSKPWNDDKFSKEEKIKMEVKEEPELDFDEATTSVSGNIPGPEPEAPIDPLECRQRLLDHIDSYQNQMESRLTSLEAQIAALESQDPDLANDETPDFYPQTKQTIQMVMKDLQTVRRIATLS